MDDGWKYRSVTAHDPAGSEFDGYAQPVPDGEWSYALDDSGIRYRRSGWPFGCESRHSRELEPSTVRLAPDTDYRSWRNEYVLLYPGRFGEWSHEATPERAHAYLDLWVRKQGMGGIIVPRVEVEIDLEAEVARVADDCPDVVRGQADMKAARLLAFLQAHIARARTPRGRRTPRTAHDAWLKRQAAARAVS
jgi:hypothetical protein